MLAQLTLVLCMLKPAAAARSRRVGSVLCPPMSMDRMGMGMVGVGVGVGVGVAVGVLVRVTVAVSVAVGVAVGADGI